MGIVLRAAYLCLTTALLFWAVTAYDKVAPPLQHHVGEALCWALMLLTFPSGMLLAIVFISFLALLDAVAGVTLPGGPMELMVVWVLYTATGYAQWFWLIPLVRSRRARKRLPNQVPAS